MSSDDSFQDSKALVIRAKVWIESDSQLIMSDYLATLLKNIDRTQSLKGAAATMKLPYRTALKKINEIESAVDSPLVESVSGGPAGGSSKLTPYAKELLKKFDAVQRQITNLEGKTL
ncbi:MAG: ModE family transcriptional regulator [Chloroflexota bacterium]|nr:ModE family transcriptional regulator [Chloroflexota bacterium]